MAQPHAAPACRAGTASPAMTRGAKAQGCRGRAGHRGTAADSQTRSSGSIRSGPLIRPLIGCPVQENVRSGAAFSGRRSCAARPPGRAPLPARLRGITPTGCGSSRLAGLARGPVCHEHPRPERVLQAPSRRSTPGPRSRTVLPADTGVRGRVLAPVPGPCHGSPGPAPQRASPFAVPLSPGPPTPSSATPCRSRKKGRAPCGTRPFPSRGRRGEPRRHSVRQCASAQILRFSA